MLLQQVLNGLVLGATYSLIALGFTLILGVLHMLNLAVGETLMIAGFIGLMVLTGASMPLPMALLAAMGVGGAISIVIYLVSFKAVNRNFFAAPILSSIGCGILMTAAAARIWGSENRRFPDVVTGPTFEFGIVRLQASQLLILGIAVAIMVALHLLVHHTRLGLAIRAVSERPSTSALMGIPVERVIVATFLLSGVIVGAGGVLTGLTFHTISPSIGFSATLTGLAIMVVGGLGNVRGAMLAGLLIGVVEVLSVALVSATFRNALTFVILIVVLIVRPQGLFTRQRHAVGIG